MTKKISITREDALRLDAADPLAHHRGAFDLPDGIYLDGNSLGPLTHASRERVHKCLDEEWGRDLIASWNKAGWIELPRTVAAKIEPIIGAEPDSVRVCDSTSVNLFKALAAALVMRPGRKRIVSQRGNFPTDLYMAEGLSSLLGQGHSLHLVEDDAPIEAAIDTDTAVVMLTHVDYRSSAMLDMAALTAAAHDAGALIIWDLAHSAGAVPVDLSAALADFAVGCGYKYLNGGPGAPAFIYAAPRHHADARNPLTGWFAHAAPFAFEPGFRGAAGMDSFLVGTPPVLSMVSLDAALDIWADVRLSDIRTKSIALTEQMIALAGELCPSLKLASPTDPCERGSHVSFAHPDAYAIVQCLIANGVVGDFRAPNIARFGVTPLYTRHVDIVDAVTTIAHVLNERLWDAPRFKARQTVT